MKWIWVAFAGLVCLAAGCSPSPTAEELKAIEARREKASVMKRAAEYLPPAAKNVKHLGGMWVTFELDIDPKDSLAGCRTTTGRFLYRYWYGSHGEVGHTITRID